jgi:DNA-binding response OmpR family regulator
MKILIIDDEQRLLDALTTALHFHWPSATVLTATDAEHGLGLALEAAPDVVILDVRLPDRTGLEVLSRIRESSDVPVILLTALADELDHVHGLELGADDYLIKPFGATALLAHIQAVLRRARGMHEPGSGKVRLDAQRRELLVAGQRVRLSSVEFRLLAYLLRQSGHAVGRSELIRWVWGDEDAASDHDLSVFIARLRARLASAEEAPLIITERGIGYRVVAC